MTPPLGPNGSPLSPLGEQGVRSSKNNKKRSSTEQPVSEAQDQGVSEGLSPQSPGGAGGEKFEEQ